jgi:hypothetical protein
MSMSQLWTLVYYSGYLTMVNCLYISSLRLYQCICTQDTANQGLDDQSYKKTSERRISVHIPNLEIQTVYHGWLQSHLHHSILVKKLDSWSQALFDTLIEGNFPKFAKRFFIQHVAIWDAWQQGSFISSLHVCIFYSGRWEVFASVEGWGTSSLYHVIMRHPFHDDREMWVPHTPRSKSLISHTESSLLL